MTLPRSIHQVRENKTSIQELLDREWYPAEKAPSAADFEIWSTMLLLHLTDADTDERDVTEYLLDLAVSELGLNATMKVRDRCRAAARSLLAMRGHFYEH